MTMTNKPSLQYQCGPLNWLFETTLLLILHTVILLSCAPLLLLLLLLFHYRQFYINKNEVHPHQQFSSSKVEEPYLQIQTNTTITMSSSSGTLWSYEEEKAFENAIALHWVEEESEELWEKIASAVPSKSMEEVKQHYQELVEDVSAIEAGQVPFPGYAGEKPTLSNRDLHGSSMATTSDKRSNCNYGCGYSGTGHESIGHSGKGGLSRSSDQERRKGIPWTEEEHRLFLLGLDKYGKGDWRSISRNFVISRTPTQVASHAQKYFIRLNSMNRDRRRSSIHDITSLNNGDIATNQEPITGQHRTNTEPSNTTAVGPSVKHRAEPHIPACLGMYRTPVGHLVAPPPPGHMPSAVGTPVMLSSHPRYVVPLTYPKAPPTMHQ